MSFLDELKTCPPREFALGAAQVHEPTRLLVWFKTKSFRRTKLQVNSFLWHIVGDNGVGFLNSEERLALREYVQKHRIPTEEYVMRALERCCNYV
ncbi:MAG: hypothetical protein E6R04_01550 [Spirochaetes bacterium]|nr:MAG: hypothetical protein E6R04_01550 [Spirochaetota bacterium]